MKAVAIAVLGLIAIFFIAFQLPTLFDAVTDFRTTELTEGYVVTTGGADTTATITLAKELFQGDIIYARTSSNVTLDVPSPQSYTSATRAVLVAGLQVSTTRMITVVYNTPKLGIYATADVSVSFFPAFLILLMITLPVIIIVAAVKGRA